MFDWPGRYGPSTHERMENMLRDAVKGKLIDIPPSVLGQDIVDESVWECTRLVIDDRVTCAGKAFPDILQRSRADLRRYKTPDHGHVIPPYGLS